MEGKLFRLTVTQAEMYDLGNIGDIDHYILYDTGSRVAIDITAEINQAPLLSEVQPYSVIFDTKVLEDFLFEKEKPAKNWRDEGIIPCITGFKAEELIGEEYNPIRQTMVKLREAQKTLSDRVSEMREHCLKTNLIKPRD